MTLVELLRQKKQATRKQLHVVVLAYPVKGHSIPLLHFASRLHSMGVVVTFVNAFSHLSSEHLKTIAALDDIRGVRVVPLGVPPPEGEVGKLPYSAHVKGLLPDAEVLLAELFSREEDAPPACIVSGMFLGWTQVLANKFKIPRYALFTAPARPLSTLLHMPELIRQGLLPFDPANKEVLLRDIPGIPPTRLADLPSPMLGDANSFFYRFAVQDREDIYEAKGILFNSFYELEPSCIDDIRRTVSENAHGQAGRQFSILPVGPLLPKAFFSGSEVPANMSDPCLKWLDTQPESSVLYVSFGSVEVLSDAQTQELARGLEASGERFLLVLRPTANPDDVSLLPKGFEDRTKGRGFVHRGWASQLEVLSHRGLGGFLTHCGWNSTLESICRGVPMLAWPIAAEQGMNARLIVDYLKAGIEVCTVTDDFVTKEKISKVVKRLMCEAEGMTAKANVRNLQKLAVAAVSEGGSVQRNLEDFLQELRS